MPHATVAELEHLKNRIEIIEEAIGKEALKKAAGLIESRHRDACTNGIHVWTQIGYDIQGGKWGTDECIHCGAEHHWHVEQGGAVVSHYTDRTGKDILR